MTSKKTPASAPRQVVIDDKAEARLRPYGGSRVEAWNEGFVNALASAMPGGTDPGERGTRVAAAALAGLLDAKPQSPIEAMLIGQMIAANNAALEGYRRAWLDEQPFEVRARYIALADKSARTVATLAESLAKIRNGGRSTVTVQHLNIGNGGQAVVAGEISADRRGGGGVDGG